ncbi:helix-turn-helix domain-containing protein [Streptomyces europaeiscabiei]|uniref:AlbA family DNA-binding domain-containing protein n=1 Tax=Streptomyces europaeiscabiei TaxID=146819 RepID=UPI002E16E1C9
MKGTFSDGIPAWYLLGTCWGDPQADRRRRGGCWNESAKDVAAMANTRGGLIIYGVQDETCELVGINPGGRVHRAVRPAGSQTSPSAATSRPCPR